PTIRILNGSTVVVDVDISGDMHGPDPFWELKVICKDGSDHVHDLVEYTGLIKPEYYYNYDCKDDKDVDNRRFGFKTRLVNIVDGGIRLAGEWGAEAEYNLCLISNEASTSTATIV